MDNQGQYKAAHEKYSALYSLDPQNFEAIVNDVSVLEKMQNTNAAYDLAKKTMTAYNSRIPQALRTSLHQHLGLFAIKKGMAREAEEHLITAMDFSENKFQILAGATEEYRKRKMYKELLSLLDKLNISNAGYALQYAIKGETLSENMQQHLEAVDAFEAAITLDPSRSEFYNGMGLAFFRMKDFKRALISFNVAAKVDPRDSVAHYNEACAFARLGQSSKALAALRTAVGLDPRLKEQAKVDSDLTSLKNTADFAQIIQSHEKQASATEVQRQRPKSSSQDIILINE